ncbi:hypothetical protein PPSIR1_00927 [Plesiocystis pacifica SIR-1]|uniref:CENP-V/GFA domain-containing protein n=2 Tax=Plesiocystis pacifica TaxID=191768 RepID=A6GCB9_9BACT|nr:hypothetical protein PPSIR1_00927 [Plesiocystis pacifica SIR-1]
MFKTRPDPDHSLAIMTTTEPTTHRGSCHCGAVRFSVEGQGSALGTAFGDAGVLACNCSMCGRAGSLMVFVVADRFTLDAGEAQLRDYQFGKGHIHHPFCSVCGIKPFAHGVDPESGATMYAVNLRCVDGSDAQVLLADANWYDGASL